MTLAQLTCPTCHGRLIVEIDQLTVASFKACCIRALYGRHVPAVQKDPKIQVKR